MSKPEVSFNPEGIVADELSSVSDTSVRYPEKVLIYAMNYSPELIGCGRYTGEIGAALEGKGVKLEVVTTPPHYPGWQARDGYEGSKYTVERSGTTRVTRCPLALYKDMRGVRRAIAPITFALSSAPVVFWRILTTRPTSVLCIEPTLFAAPAALLAARLVGARTLLHVQDLEIDAAFAVGHVKSKLLQRITGWFDRAVTCKFDSVVTISGMMAKALLGKGVNSSRLSIIRNWVDTSKIHPLPRPSAFREELGIARENKVVLYAGNIGPKQALHFVMDAAAVLTDRDDIVFVIAGEGPEKAKLQARKLPNVVFLPLQPEAKLNELLNLADIHVLPQDRGAADLVLPSKIGGMLASRKKIVAMAEKDTEIYDFLRHDAALVPPADVRALVAAICHLASSNDDNVTELNQPSRTLDSLSAERSMAHFFSLLK
jgi:colanic acid biosynthesis glycosyl transferase WcaI